MLKLTKSEASNAPMLSSSTAKSARGLIWAAGQLVSRQIEITMLPYGTCKWYNSRAGCFAYFYPRAQFQPRCVTIQLTKNDLKLRV
ncbi:hypothetical protein GCM10008965_37380 [Methylorubrum aminovorans]